MTSLPPLYLATLNPGKIVELEDLLGRRFVVEPRPPELADTVEDGATLVANAIKKATEVAEHCRATALADDTGLFVEALDGRPGVRSARYAGAHGDDAANRSLMLSELDGVVDRRAHFETVIVMCFGGAIPDLPALSDSNRSGEPVVARGRVDGTITTEPRGTGGFGYDSIFVPDEGDGRTFAQLTLAEKGAISHRGRALVDLGRLLGLT